MRGFTTVCIIIQPESALNFKEKNLDFLLKISMDEEMARRSGR
jgi:hypothetical protein